MLDRRLRRGLPRLVRGGFVALLTLSLGVGAHVSAGGYAPSIGSAGVLALFFGATCWGLSAQTWTARPLLAVFLLAQLATHVVSMLEHPYQSMGGASMASTHVVAAAVLVLLVTRGETALIRMLDHLALRSLALRATPPSRPTVPRLIHRAVWVFARLCVQSVRDRAPPTAVLLPAV